MVKLRFNTGAEAVFASAKIAESKGCDMTSTCLWVSVKEDEQGYFIEVTEEDSELI